MEAAPDAGCALSAALARFWAIATDKPDLLNGKPPSPGFIQANMSPSCSISHATLRRWMLKVSDALAPPLTGGEKGGSWLVVAIAVSPCSVEETALMLMAAEHRDWVYVPIDVTLPPERQHELLRTARVDRVVALPRSPLARLLTEPRFVNERVAASAISAVRSAVIASDCEAFQTVEVITLERYPEESLHAAVAFSLGKCCKLGAADAAVSVPAPLYVLFTSGSTREPKGVLGTRVGAWNRMQWMWTWYPFSAGQERVMRAVRLTFVDSVWEILGAFLKRVPLVHVAAQLAFDDDRLDAEDSQHIMLSERTQFLQRTMEHCVTRLTVVPSVLEVLLAQKSRRELELALASLRYLLISGETLPLKLVLQLADALPRVTMLNLYGSTEISGDVTCMALPHPITAKDVAVWSDHGVPIGTAVDVIGSMTSMRLMGDGGSSFSLPMNELTTSRDEVAKGELWVSGHPVAFAYISLADGVELLGSSADKHAENSDEQPRQHMGTRKWFKTGDVCAIVGGNLYFCGRHDLLVKIRGLRIQLEAVERQAAQALSELEDRALDGVSQVVAFDVDTATKYGFSHRQLVVCVVLSHSDADQRAAVNEETASNSSFAICRLKPDICRWIAEKFGSAMVPHEVCTISSDAAKKLSNGKLDRRGLVSRYLAWRNSILTAPKWSNEGTTDPIAAFVKAQLNFLATSERDWGRAVLSTLTDLGLDSLSMTLFHFELQQQFPGFATSPDQLATMTIGDLVASLHKLQGRGNRHVLPWYRPIEDIGNDSEVPQKRRKQATQAHEATKNDRRSLRFTALSRCNQASSGPGYIPICPLPLPFPRRIDAGVPTMPRIAPTFKLAWHADLKKCVDASPLVVATQNKDGSESRCAIIGSHAGIVLCVDVDKGEQLWKAQLDDRIEASATLSVRDELVYVGTYAGMLFALDLHSGAAQWTYQCGGMIKSAAVVVEELGIVVAGAYDQKIHAVTAREGSPVWTFDVGASIFSTPVFVQEDGLQYLLCATTRGDLISLSCNDAPARRWEKQLPAPVFAGISIDQSLDLAVLGCADGNVYGIAASSGVTRWTVQTNKPVFSSPCLYKSCFVVIGSHDGHLRKIDAMNGQVAWSTKLDGAIFSSPTVFRAAMSSSPSRSSTTSALTQESLQSTAKDAANSRFLCCVATTVGSVYIIDEQSGEEIDCVDSLRRTDEPEASENLLGEIFSSPVMIGQYCLVGTRSNSLLAFRLT